MSVKVEPLKHDNCKDCISGCEHAGKNREFVYRGESCKVVKQLAQLNREAWKPCEYCKTKRCFNCKYNNLPMKSEPCNSCAVDNWEPKYKFCPECGRPLTDAAWEMLEKRLEEQS